MNTTIREVEVSAQHAVFAWNGAAWMVRDLGSRNGTFVNGQPLEPGAEAPLEVGATIYLGAERHSFQFLDDGAPAPSASCPAAIVEGDGDLLALPSPEDPQVIVTADDDDGWVKLVGDDSAPVEDGDILEVGGQPWTLMLPEVLAQTFERRISDVTIHDIGLRFRVSSDEEYVELTVHTPKGDHPRKPRAQHYILLTLARARLEDAREGVTASEQGWVYTSDLEKMLRASANQIYVSIHRARKEIESLDILGASNLVERRPTTRQVRLGVSDLSVDNL